MKLFISGYSTKNKSSIGYYSISDDQVALLWEDSIEAPSFLSYTNNFLFAVSEVEKTCTIFMYSIVEDELGLVDEINLPIGGVCHIEYLEKSRILLGSSYEEGIVFSVGVSEQGFKQLINKVQQPESQMKLSRVHCTLTTDNERVVYVSNIASDRIYKYRHVAGRLEEIECLTLAIGSGPRHLCFGANESKLYVITEYSNETMVIDLQDDQMSLISINKNVEPNKGLEQYGSSLSMSKDGRFLYCSTRGTNTISVFKVSDEGLTLTQTTDCGGNWPRHVALVGEDNYLAVANQYSSEIALLEVDRISGHLTMSRSFKTYESVSFIGDIN